MARALVSRTSIIGEVRTYAGPTAPEGYLLCQGQAVSRTTYSALFSVLGTSHGQGDGSTTFNLPDYRGTFLRGRVNISTVTGSGTVPVTPNNTQATFSNHGINRTGFKIRLSSGTLGGLAVSTDYYAIIVDNNTLAFATTLANAIAGVRITLTSASINSAVIVQYEDPDYASRTASTVGGDSAGGLGSIQSYALQNITGQLSIAGDTFIKITTPAANGAFSEVTAGSLRASPGTSGSFTQTAGFDASRVAQTSTETRPKNSLINYIIKY
jgi:microcystin-dependent protein